VSLAVIARPPAVDLRLYQGDDFALTLTVTNADGTVADLTGATFAAVIAVPGATVSAADFATTVAGNVVTLTLAAADSAQLPAAAVWQCRMTSAAGAVRTLVAGNVTVQPQASP
jgi:hypothetical protein